MLASIRAALRYASLLLALAGTACSAGVRDAGAATGFSLSIVLHHRLYYVHGFVPTPRENEAPQTRRTQRSRRPGI